jgi:cysteine-rich repeat protein
MKDRTGLTLLQRPRPSPSAPGEGRWEKRLLLAPLLALALYGCGAVCGDGVTQGNEACDDGANADGDGCSALCKLEGACGDGILDGGEGCDDGNTDGGDGCAADCAALEVCGSRAPRPATRAPPTATPATTAPPTASSPPRTPTPRPRAPPSSSGTASLSASPSSIPALTSATA